MSFTLAVDALPLGHQGGEAEGTQKQGNSTDTPVLSTCLVTVIHMHGKETYHQTVSARHEKIFFL